MIGTQTRRVRLMAARMLSPAVRSLVFEPVGDPLEYRAGQFVQLTVPTATGLAMRRPYSVASAPGFWGRGAFELAVTKVEGGPTSRALHDLPIGAEVVAGGPNGGWLCLPADEGEARTLMVATGSGLAPFRALIQQEVQAPQGARLALLFGCRTPEDVLWRDELQGWERSRPRIRVGVTLSRPSPAWDGLVGHVQRHLLEFVRELEPERVLICGLSPMVEEVEGMLRKHGLPDKAVRTELYDR